MKNYKYLFLIISILIITSCERAAQDEEWGYSLLYIPQAINQSGGTNNNFEVTISAFGANDTSIVVGIYRSGLAPIQSVTADLTIDQDTLANAISYAQTPGVPATYDIYKNAKLLSSDYYTLPANISLEEGSRSNFVLLEIKKNLILADPDFATKVFILPVRIENPTRYELNEDLSLVMFVFKR